MNKQLNVLVLYDPVWTHIPTVNEFLRGLQRYSRHRIVFAPTRCGVGSRSTTWLHDFDVVVLHYSAKFTDWPLTALGDELRSFTGLKAAFLQDEYECTEATRQALELLRITLVFTVVPEVQREKFYPQHRFPHVRFVGVLTGYVPLDLERRRRLAQPLSERPIEIGYRGRQLAYWYGSLAMEKWWIGRDVKALCKQTGVVCDIAWSESDRLYGDDWYRFLGQCVATLGCESGANLIDEHGAIRHAVEKYLETRPDADFDEVRGACFAEYDGIIQMNQISPRVFEAIAMDTALVLYTGKYSGVIEPGRHFFPLKKDYSNFDAAVRFVRNPALVRAMTERAFEDVVASGLYAHKALAGVFDTAVADGVGSYDRGESTPQWSLAPAGHNGSMRFVLIDSNGGDGRGAVAAVRAGAPSSELLHVDTSLVTLRGKKSFLRQARLYRVASKGTYFCRLPDCRIEELQLEQATPQIAELHGRVVLSFRGEQTYAGALHGKSGTLISISEPVLADELSVSTDEPFAELTLVAKGTVRRLAGLHSFVPPIRRSAAQRLWHTLPLPLRLSPPAMRAKALAHAVKTRWRTTAGAIRDEPLLRRQ